MARSRVGMQIAMGLKDLLDRMKSGETIAGTMLKKLPLRDLLEQEGLGEDAEKSLAEGRVLLCGKVMTDLDEVVYAKSGDVVVVGEKTATIKKGGFTPRTRISRINVAEFD